MTSSIIKLRTSRGNKYYCNLRNSNTGHQVQIEIVEQFYNYILNTYYDLTITKNEKLSNDNAELTTKNEKLNNDNGKLTENNEKLTENNKKLIKDNEELEGIKSKLELDIEGLKKTRDKLEKDNDGLRDTITEKDKTITEKDKTIANKDIELKKKDTELEKSNKTNNNLMIVQGELKQTNIKLKSGNDLLEKQHNLLTGYLESVINGSTDLSDRHKKFITKVKKFIMKYNSLKKENKTLKEQIDTLKNQNDNNLPPTSHSIIFNKDFREQIIDKLKKYKSISTFVREDKWTYDDLKNTLGESHYNKNKYYTWYFEYNNKIYFICGNKVFTPLKI
jgi:chromosome segregation ATPase